MHGLRSGVVAVVVPSSSRGLSGCCVSLSGARYYGMGLLCSVSVKQSHALLINPCGAGFCFGLMRSTALRVAGLSMGWARLEVVLVLRREVFFKQKIQRINIYIGGREHPKK